jgi:hypothetical protein
MFKRILLSGLIAALVLTACQTQRGSAKDLLPDIPNTTVVEGETITQFLAKAADGAALAAASPQLIPLIQRVEASLTCYQDLGAVALRTYTDKQFALSAGLIAIVDRKALTDPANFRCVLERRLGTQASSTPTINPASDLHAAEGRQRFHIAYIATTRRCARRFVRAWKAAGQW